LDLPCIWVGDPGQLARGAMKSRSTKTNSGNGGVWRWGVVRPRARVRQANRVTHFPRIWRAGLSTEATQGHARGRTQEGTRQAKARNLLDSFLGASSLTGVAVVFGCDSPSSGEIRFGLRPPGARVQARRVAVGAVGFSGVLLEQGVFKCWSFAPVQGPAARRKRAGRMEARRRDM